MPARHVGDADKVVGQVAMLVVCTGLRAEACASNEKNKVLGGTWMPEGGPAFIPVNNMDDIHVQQPTQRITHQSKEEPGYIKHFYALLSYLNLCRAIVDLDFFHYSSAISSEYTCMLTDGKINVPYVLKICCLFQGSHSFIGEKIQDFPGPP